MSALEPLLALMQINDSLFPSGAFVHSYGLEQLAREGRLRTPADAETFVRSVLQGSLATADALTAARAHAAASAGCLEALIAADRALGRSKAAEELRTASLSTGRRLLDEVLAFSLLPLLQRYADAVHADRRLGFHPAVFGAVAALSGVGASVSVAALLQGAVSGMLQATMRLLPVSHRDVQAALQRLRPAIAAAAERVVASPSLALMSFHPLQEIASMRHSGATARLFAS